MPRSANAASSACRRRRRRRDGRAEWHHQRDLAGVAQAALDQVVVHHQRGLARRGRALERCRGDTDDDPAAGECGEHVARRERTVHGVELVAGLDEAGRRRGVEVGARGPRPARRPRSAGVGLDPARCRIDGPDRGLHEPHAGLDQSRYGCRDRLGRRAAEHDVELGEAEDESVGPVDQDDVDVVTELVGQPRRQLEAAEAGAQHEFAWPSAFSRRSAQATSVRTAAGRCGCRAWARPSCRTSPWPGRWRPSRR